MTDKVGIKIDLKQVISVHIGATPFDCKKFCKYIEGGNVEYFRYSEYKKHVFRRQPIGHKLVNL